MFKVRPDTQAPTGASILCNGARLGYPGQAMRFFVNSDAVPDDLFVDIVVTRTSDTDPSMITVGKITGNRLPVEILNPPRSITTTNLFRQHLLFIQDRQLTFSFVMVDIVNAPHFLFFYEFYEEPTGSNPPLPGALPPTGLK
jgi:hypothetical protein